MYPVSDAFKNTVRGSHTPLFEARVCPDFQSGPDPAGVAVPILGGQVEMDGTAVVQRTLTLDTQGEWPRRGDDLLGPWGNDVFVRAGVRLAGDVAEWVPLGYFRINEPSQEQAPAGTIALEGVDRMQQIRDERLLTPRQFATGTELGAVVQELVWEVFPLASIVWDDSSDQATLVRPLTVERDRYEPLKDAALSAGKIMWWDGEGRLRFTATPEQDHTSLRDATLELAAGEGGVLLNPRRRISREGVYNGVVAYGEGTDTQQPARAVVVDRGPRSPTRWGSRFGRVPRFYSSPYIETAAQASTAARSMLRRQLGFPYTLDMTLVPNYALEPWDVTRVRLRDGARELHQLETLTVPLVAGEPMDASTKEQSSVVMGAP